MNDLPSMLPVLATVNIFLPKLPRIEVAFLAVSEVRAPRVILTYPWLTITMSFTEKLMAILYPQLNYNKNDSFNIAILNNPDLQSVNKMTKWPYAEVVVY